MPLSPVFNMEPSPKKGEKGNYVRTSLLLDPTIMGKMQIIIGQRTMEGRKVNNDLTALIREASIIYLGLLESLGTVDYDVVLKAVKEALKEKKAK